MPRMKSTPKRVKDASGNKAGTISTYEEFRDRNIAERNEMFADLLKDVKGLQTKMTPAASPKKPRNAVKREREADDTSYYQYYKRPTRESPPVTRSRRSSLASSNEDVLLFPTEGPRRSLRLCTDYAAYGQNETKRGYAIPNDDDPEPKKKKQRKGGGRSRHVVDTRRLLRPENVTEDDLAMVAYTIREKAYDTVNGTSCHQCRQKTTDTKTVCHSDLCVGVRGQFCGVCLRNRYGEDVRDALLDEDWICPVCRNLCNCSFCMPRKGMSCTGIMVYEAKKSGYNNVKDYLLRKTDS